MRNNAYSVVIIYKLAAS